jgi:hypothetical protein
LDLKVYEIGPITRRKALNFEADNMKRGKLKADRKEVDPGSNIIKWSS